MKMKLNIIKVFVLAIYLFSMKSQAQIGNNIFNLIKIGKLSGIASIANGGTFGWDCDTLGDLNGDGTMDFAIGAPYSYVNAPYSGMIHILFMHPNKTVKSTKIISRSSGNINVPFVGGNDLIGITICNIGDFNHDGTNDLAIGLENNDQVSLIMLDTNGTVKTTYNLATTQTGFFGSDIINLGDIDNDGVTDIMVSGYHNGIYILKLNSNGTIKSTNQFVSSLALGYTGTNSDNFPAVTRQIGDLDGNGIKEIVAGAPAYNNGKGEIVILYLNTDYTLKSYKKISSGSLNFTTLNNGDYFGCEIQRAGDLNNDGIIDIFVGAIGDDFGGSNSNNFGSVYGICLNNLGEVKTFFKLDKGNCQLNKFLKPDDYFGLGISVLGDIDNDNNTDYLMSSFKDDEGGIDNGAFYILSLGNGGGTNNSTSTDTSFCIGNSVLLQVDTNFISYLWNTGDTIPKINVNNSGLFICESMDSSGCLSRDTIKVTSINPPLQHSLLEKTICFGESYPYTLDPGFSYQWWDGSTSNTNILSDSGIYWVQVYNQCDSIIDSVFISKKDCNCNIFIPNVFTPNEDGINDNFFPVISCKYDDYHIYIFNRWGKLIFESTDQDEVWNGEYEGKKVPDGVYLYLINYLHLYTSNKWQEKMGSVTIFR